MNIVERLEIELAYYDVKTSHVNLNARGIPPKWKKIFDDWYNEYDDRENEE